VTTQAQYASTMSRLREWFVLENLTLNLDNIFVYLDQAAKAHASAALFGNLAASISFEARLYPDRLPWTRDPTYLAAIQGLQRAATRSSESDDVAQPSRETILLMERTLRGRGEIASADALRVSFAGGLRAGELAKVRMDSFIEESGDMHLVLRNTKTRGVDPRAVPDEDIQAMKDICQRARAAGCRETLFPPCRLKMTAYKVTITELLREAAVTAGQPGLRCTLHSVRHGAMAERLVFAEQTERARAAAGQALSTSAGNVHHYGDPRRKRHQQGCGKLTRKI